MRAYLAGLLFVLFICIVSSRSIVSFSDESNNDLVEEDTGPRDTNEAVLLASLRAVAKDGNDDADDDQSEIEENNNNNNSSAGDEKINGEVSNNGNESSNDSGDEDVKSVNDRRGEDSMVKNNDNQLDEDFE